MSNVACGYRKLALVAGVLGACVEHPGPLGAARVDAGVDASVDARSMTEDAAVVTDAAAPTCVIRATRTTKPADVVTIDVLSDPIGNAEAIVFSDVTGMVVGATPFTTSQVSIVLSGVPAMDALTAFVAGATDHDVSCKADIVTN